MITNDHYNINPPGTDSLRYKICFPHSKTHRVYSGPESVAASENPTRIEIYSWWNTLIRSPGKNFNAIARGSAWNEAIKSNNA